jgi:hypothetical protein
MRTKIDNYKHSKVENINYMMSKKEPEEPNEE